MKKIYSQIFLFFLLINPWLVQFILSGSESFWNKGFIGSFNDFISNFAIYTSPDYLFFMQDKRIQYWNQETGPFYIFQIIPILFGFYLILFKSNKFRIILFCWFLIGLFLASLFKFAPEFSVSLLYLFPLQIIDTLGLFFLMKIWTPKKSINKIMISVLFLLAIYEMIIYFHIMWIHYPKRLLLQ